MVCRTAALSTSVDDRVLRLTLTGSQTLGKAAKVVAVSREQTLSRSANVTHDGISLRHRCARRVPVAWQLPEGQVPLPDTLILGAFARGHGLYDDSSM